MIAEADLSNSWIFNMKAAIGNQTWKSFCFGKGNFFKPSPPKKFTTYPNR